MDFTMNVAKARHRLVYCLTDEKDTFLIESNRAAVMKDPYPKAQYHFLVVCKEDIANVTKLTREHIPLLDHMMDLANQIIEQQNHLNSSHFLVGFKMDAFMDRLNMHVISNDFYSVSLRNISHWNSFNSDLFLTYQAAYALLRLQGCIEPLSAERALELRKAQPLQCNQCAFKDNNLLALKAHLFNHWNDREHGIEVKRQVDKITEMLDESKLDETLSKVESPKTDEPAKMQPITWRQNPDQKQANANSSVTKEPPANWRQRSTHVPNNQEQQQSAQPYSNYFQMSANRHHQPNVHPLLEPSLMGPAPVFTQHNLAQHGYPLNLFQQQFSAPNGLPFMNFEHQRHNRMWNANNNINQPQSTASPPRFNPFKQAPRQLTPANSGSQPGATIQEKPKYSQKPPYKHNPGDADSSGNSSAALPAEPNKTNQNKPKWTAKPQQKQKIITNDDVGNNSNALKNQPKKPIWKPKGQHNQDPKSHMNKAAGNKPNWKPKPTPNKEHQSPNPTQTQPEKS